MIRAHTTLKSITKQVRHLLKLSNGRINFGKPIGHGQTESHGKVNEVASDARRIGSNLLRNEHDYAQNKLASKFKGFSKSQIKLANLSNHLTPDQINKLTQVARQMNGSTDSDDTNNDHQPQPNQPTDDNK